MTTITIVYGAIGVVSLTAGAILLLSRPPRTEWGSHRKREYMTRLAVSCFVCGVSCGLTLLTRHWVA